MTTSDRILRAAAELFAAKGYGSTSTRDIAAAVGIRQPTLYKHFAAKDEILLALVRIALEPPARLAEALAVTEGAAAARLCRWLSDAAHYYAAMKYSIISLLHTPEQISPRLSAEWQKYAAMEARLAVLVAEGQREGDFAAGEAFAEIRLTLTLFDSFAPGDVEIAHDTFVAYAMAALLVDRRRLGRVLRQASALNVPPLTVPESR